MSDAGRRRATAELPSFDRRHVTATPKAGAAPSVRRQASSSSSSSSSATRLSKFQTANTTTTASTEHNGGDDDSLDQLRRSTFETVRWGTQSFEQFSERDKAANRKDQMANGYLKAARPELSLTHVDNKIKATEDRSASVNVCVCVCLIINRCMWCTVVLCWVFVFFRIRQAEARLASWSNYPVASDRSVSR
jgi:hypothetical protein